jgi:hypothetical protein
MEYASLIAYLEQKGPGSPGLLYFIRYLVIRKGDLIKPPFLYHQ